MSTKRGSRKIPPGPKKQPTRVCNMKNSFHSTLRPASNGDTKTKSTKLNDFVEITSSDEDEKRPARKKKKTSPPPKVDYSPVIAAVTAVVLPGTNSY